jgi:hypothetical protein
MPLLAKALESQLELGVPYSCCLVSYHPERSNSYLIRFYEKHLKPLNVALAEYYQAMKTL